jgi:tripartite ATP-independent transporter DctM subunit
MATGMPVALCFLLIDVVAAFLFMGGIAGLEGLIVSLYTSLATFILLPLPLFILMGEVMLHSGIAPNIINTIEQWLGRLPGRLSLIAVAAGTVFSVLTGTAMGSVAMLGAVLLPEMERRNYNKAMILGPILASGGIAIMIPPSALAILFGAVGLISIGKILMAIIVPGLLLAILIALYIIIRSYLQPSMAPPYSASPVPLSKKLIDTVHYLLPIGFIVFMVIGLILIGVATPSEAAAGGALGIFILAAIYRKLNWEVVKKSVSSTASITVMIFMMICGAVAFSQILAKTGATTGLTQFMMTLPISPIAVIIGMQIIVLILGMLMELSAIIMITTPIFIPIVLSLGFDPVWFAALTLLNIQLGTMSPPFGLSLFVMKSVAPPDTTMGDVYRASLPFFGTTIIAMILVLAFPQIALWLPGMMR